MPTLPFVGRDLELASLREMCAQRSAAVIIADAGLGKSRLISELSSDPEMTCVIGVGAPELQTSPYAAFRTLALQWARLLDPDSLGWTESQKQNLGPLFPALQGERGEEHNTEERRQGLWMSLLRYLDSLVAVHPRPLVLILEDLHAVDESSLALFSWLSSQPLDMAVIATSRPDAPDLVAKLPTIGLRPLGLSAIELIQRATDATSVTSETLLALTGGVPLRLHEWVLGASLGGPTHAHVALLDRVLDGAPDATLDALRLAATFPGAIDAYLLASVLDAPLPAANEVLAEAEARGVMTQHRDGTWTFYHESYRASLLEDLDRPQRRACERRVIEGLRDRLDSRPDLLGNLAEIATNLADDRAEAAELHLAAGQHAIAQLSPAAARQHFQAAVELAEPTNQADLLLRCTLSLGLVLASTGAPNAASTLAKVYALADSCGDGDAFARAALAEPVGLAHIAVPRMTTHRVVARLRSALTKTHDPALRARLLTALALQQHNSLSEADYFSLVDQAEQIACDVGDAALDSQILAARLGARRATSGSDEWEGQVESQLNRLEPFDPNALHVVDLAVMLACRAGDLARAERLIRRYEDEFAPLPVVAQWSMLRARTAIAFARGSIEIARTHALEALHTTTDTRLDEVALEHFGFQIAALLRERRRLADARPTMETWVVEHPSYAPFRASRAWLYADLGELDAARSDLEVFFAQDLTELRSSAEGPLALSMAVCAAFAMGGSQVRDWCERSYELLRPLADEWLLVGQGSLIEGPVARVLALASAALGETERALAENERAKQLAQEAGALLFVWHTERDRGLILQRAGRIDQAAVQVRGAAARYRAAGLSQQADWLDTQVHDPQPAKASSPSPDPTTPPTSRGTFQRDNRVWLIGLDDESAICRHLKGMSMIAALLAAPNKQVAAGVLAAVGDGSHETAEHRAIRSESAQPVVDDFAVRQYRARLDEIVGELDRADRRGDAEASNKLAAEFEAITAELSSTHGLGNRRRTMTSEDERARIRVTKAIRSAIRRIGEQAPDVAQHLERSVDTGLFCSYRPDARHPVTWALHAEP